MRKLPLFGKQMKESQIDFKYPDEKQFQKLKSIIEEVKLESITTQHWVLHGIQLNFTGGGKTPMFIDDGQHANKLH